jgi:hypothetical protein
MAGANIDLKWWERRDLMDGCICFAPEAFSYYPHLNDHHLNPNLTQLLTTANVLSIHKSHLCPSPPQNTIKEQKPSSQDIYSLSISLKKYLLNLPPCGHRPNLLNHPLSMRVIKIV